MWVCLRTVLSNVSEWVGIIFSQVGMGLVPSGMCACMGLAMCMSVGLCVGACVCVACVCVWHVRVCVVHLCVHVLDEQVVCVSRHKIS